MDPDIISKNFDNFRTRKMSTYTELTFLLLRKDLNENITTSNLDHNCSDHLTEGGWINAFILNTDLRIYLLLHILEAAS